MKKVIKPSKQPTKKQSIQSQRSQRSKQSQQSQRSKQTAKLKIAIGKIAAQLVKNHPKLVKGGGSSDITELIFSKNLMKGGEIKPELREDIIEFLKKFAPKVNDLKHNLLIKVIQNFINAEVGSVYAVTDSSVSIVNLHKEFNKGVYEYKAEDYKGKFEDEKDIYDDFIILDIVKKFYILSSITDADIKEINNSKFKGLSDEIIDALTNYKHYNDQKKIIEDKKEIKRLLELYKSAGTEAVKEDRIEGKKVVEDSNIDFKLNIRIEAAIAAAVAAKNELDAIKNAQYNEKEAGEDVKVAATEAVKKAAENALKKATEAAEAVAKTAAKKEADVKAAVAAVEEAKEAAVAEEEAVVKAAVADAIIAAIAALIAIYTDNNSYRRDTEITEGDGQERQEEEGTLVVNNSSKDKEAYSSAVDEIKKIMTTHPSQEQNRRALYVLSHPTFTEDTDDKKLAKAAATVAADYVEIATEEQKDRAIAKATENFKSTGGKSAPKYKSTGQVVNIMYKKRKYKRTIFVKEKRKTKYCKINNEYILLSKLNVL